MLHQCGLLTHCPGLWCELNLQSVCQGENMVITTFLCRDLEEALEMGMDWSLREGVPLCPTCVCVSVHKCACFVCFWLTVIKVRPLI